MGLVELQDVNWTTMAIIMWTAIAIWFVGWVCIRCVWFDCTLSNQQRFTCISSATEHVTYTTIALIQRILQRINQQMSLTTMMVLSVYAIPYVGGYNIQYTDVLQQSLAYPNAMSCDTSSICSANGYSPTSSPVTEQDNDGDGLDTDVFYADANSCVCQGVG